MGHLAPHHNALARGLVDAVVSPLLLFIIGAKVFKNHVMRWIAGPGIWLRRLIAKPRIIGVLLEHVHAVLLIGVGASVVPGAVLRKAFRKVPSEPVNLE